MEQHPANDVNIVFYTYFNAKHSKKQRKVTLEVMVKPSKTLDSIDVYTYILEIQQKEGKSHKKSRVHRFGSLCYPHENTHNNIMGNCYAKRFCIRK